LREVKRARPLFSREASVKRRHPASEAGEIQLGKRKCPVSAFDPKQALAATPSDTLRILTDSLLERTAARWPPVQL